MRQWHPVKLWIDDIRDPPSGDWLIARSSRDAIAMIEMHHVTEISFDHDLGGTDTAVRVADLIEKRAYWRLGSRIKWHVHSANPVGRARLEQALRKADQYWSILEAEVVKGNLL